MHDRCGQIRASLSGWKKYGREYLGGVVRSGCNDSWTSFFGTATRWFADGKYPDRESVSTVISSMSCGSITVAEPLKHITNVQVQGVFVGDSVDEVTLARPVLKF